MLKAALNNCRPTPRGIIAIPARLESSRLPRKLLLAETGRPLLAHVIGQAQQATELANDWLSEVIVACDHADLCRVAESCGVRCVMTSRLHRNGTTRIAEAVQHLSLQGAVDFVVNVQADQPELPPGDIVQLAKELMRDASNDMATLAVAMRPGTEALRQNTDVVKVTMDSRQRASCFSRSPIPFDSSDTAGEATSWWFRHVGIYAYRIETLHEIAQLPPSEWEIRENLEQLRALDAGKAIRVTITSDSSCPQGIDTLEDYRCFVERWRTQCRIW